MKEFDQMDQFLIGCGHAGQMIGELALIYNDDVKKNKRLYTCFCKSEFAIVVSINKMVFDILMREKTKKDNEILAHFIFRAIPDMSRHYTLNKVLREAKYVFDKKEITKGEILQYEGKESNRLFFIFEG